MGPIVGAHSVTIGVLTRTVHLLSHARQVACTSFVWLFNEMRKAKPDGFKLPGSPAQKGFWFSNTPAKHGLTKNDVADLLVDPTWYKATFYREPLSRFLSGYRSKCEPGHDGDTKHCLKQFGSKTASFPEAVSALAQLDKTIVDKAQVVDEHWQRQARFCGGLENTLSVPPSPFLCCVP